MAEEVENSSQHWTDDDLRAVATYLKESTVADGKAPAPLAATDARMLAGREIYADRCSACHTSNGEGMPKLFPQLANAPLVNGDDATSLMRVVLAGSRAGGTVAAPTGPAMPSFAWNLSDADVANVLTYIRNSWGNAASPVDPGNVREMRKKLSE
jgi:mono/diheme cytochrome c family protein